MHWAEVMIVNVIFSADGRMAVIEPDPDMVVLAGLHQISDAEDEHSTYQL